MRLRLLCCLCLVLAAAVPCRAADESVYHGKPRGHWLKAAQDKDPSVRAEAVTALGEMGLTGPAVLAALTAALKDADEGVRGAAGDALAKLGPAAVPALTQAAADKDQLTRAGAAAALGRIGPKAATAVGA